jgi:protein TonB
MKTRVFILALCCAYNLSGQADSSASGQEPPFYFSILEYCGYTSGIQHAVKRDIRYPEAALRAGKEGTVIFSVLFNWERKVSDPQIMYDPAGIGIAPDVLERLPFNTYWSDYHLRDDRLTIRVVRYLHFRLSDTSITYLKVHPDFCGPLETPWQSEQASKVYEIFDLAKTASFPGGERELMSFLKKELGPFSCHRDSLPVGTKTIVEFVVNKDGSLQNIRILKSAHPCTDEAVLAALRRMPRWSPAEANGCPVRLRYVLPIRIRWE